MSAEPIVKLHSPTDAAAANDLAPEVRAVELPASHKRLIRLGDLFARLDVSKATGHRLIAAGKIGPRAIRLTSACVRLFGDEVEAWLSTRKPNGDLHDAKSWPAVWEAMQRKRK